MTVPHVNPDALAAALKTGALSDPFLTDRVKAKLLLDAAASALRAEGAAAERDRIRQLPFLRALSDPGSITPRRHDEDGSESVPAWQQRALLDLLRGDRP